MDEIGSSSGCNYYIQGLKLLLKSKERIWRRLKILRCLFLVEKPLGFFSLCKMPSFNYKSNFSDFVLLAE